MCVCELHQIYAPFADCLLVVPIDNRINTYISIVLELQKFLNEEWLLSRKKIYQLEDFIAKWKMETQKQPESTLTIRMMKELQIYEVIT